MFKFIADYRDGYKSQNGCAACCCETIHMKPGEINMLSVQYGGWVIPLRGRGLSVNTWFEVVKVNPDVATGGNNAPIVLPFLTTTAIDTAFTGDLATVSSDPEADALTWSLVGLYSPGHGEVTIASNGDFTYTPHSGYEGVDRFYYEVSDGFNKVRGVATVLVGSVPVQLGNPPQPVMVMTQRKQINSEYFEMAVPIAVDPAAPVGDIYRINVRQEAYDCDGNPFYHISCYDVVIGKC